MLFRNKLKLNIVAVICIICIVSLFVSGGFLISDTYARYKEYVSRDGTMDVANWSVVLKNNSEPLSKMFNVVFTRDTENAHVGGNKIAPGISMHAVLVLDLTGTEVAVDYKMTVDTRALDENIQTGDILFNVYEVFDDGTETPINLGKETHISLKNKQAFTSENGRHTFKFVLTWNLDGDALTDVEYASNFSTLSLPVSLRVRQHLDGAGPRKVSSDISYFETIRSKVRETQLVGYVVKKQDILSDNPEKGFYSTSLLALTESGRDTSYYTATKSSTSNLLQLKVDLSAFSGNMNGTAESAGVDKALTAQAITELEKVLEQIKQNDNTVILRFVYDNFAWGEGDEKVAGKTKIEPSHAMLLSHIGALGATFRKYASTINAIQMGFYGLWGENFYCTDILNQENHGNFSETVQALLTETRGTEITIAVRTPEYYTWYRNSEISDIDNVENYAQASEDAYRVGIFNDAYGANETDIGTYKNREKETEWLSYQSEHTYFGGEAIIADTPSGIGDYNKPEYFIEEAYKLHTSYLNWEWNQALHIQWAKMKYSGKDIAYNGTALAYIESRLGYRFVVEDVKTYRTVTSGETLPIDITIRNSGFGNLVKSKRCDIVIVNAEGETAKVIENVDIDAKDFTSQQSVTKSIDLDLTGLGQGSYSVYLRMSSGETLSGGRYYSAIRFANDDMWNENLQANYIATFEME